MRNEFERSLCELNVHTNHSGEGGVTVFDDCFSEIIRQEAIVCEERGEVLSIIRDEYMALIKAYESLFESSAAFAIRKSNRVGTQSAYSHF